MATVALSGIITPSNVVTATSTTTLSNKTLVAPALGTPASGVVTNLTGTASININGTVGATTPAAGAFTGVNTPNTFGFKNRLINGDMEIDQRNAGASITPSANGTMCLDRWKCGLNTGLSPSKYSVQQSSTAPAGFSNSVLITSTSAYTVQADDYATFSQAIEGFNFADFGFGTANAQSLTISFQIRCSLTGTFAGWIQNDAVNRSYPFTFTISTANTWESKSITIAGDTTGTWVGATNGTGLLMGFNLGVGSTRQGTANTWGAGNFRSVSGAVNLIATNAATMNITGVQLEKGSTATSFDVRPYGTEYQLCQRYFEKSLADGTAATASADSAPFFIGGAYTTGNVRTQLSFKVPKRATPTITPVPSNTGSGTGTQWTYFNGSWIAGSTALGSSNANGFSIDVATGTVTAYSAYLVSGNWYASAEL